MKPICQKQNHGLKTLHGGVWKIPGLPRPGDLVQESSTWFQTAQGPTGEGAPLQPQSTRAPWVQASNLPPALEIAFTHSPTHTLP